MALDALLVERSSKNKQGKHVGSTAAVQIRADGALAQD